MKLLLNLKSSAVSDKSTARALLVLPLLLAIGAAELGCINCSPSQPKALSLAEAAKRFREKCPTNRYEEALTLKKLLPSTPIAWEHDTGIGVIRSYDHSRVSYHLRISDLVNMIGKPQSINGVPMGTNWPSDNSATYIIQSQDSGDYYLSIDTYGDNIEKTVIYGISRTQPVPPDRPGVVYFRELEFARPER